MNNSEPEYLDAGREFEDDSGEGRERPKWMLPATPFQQRVLALFGRKYYQARYERTTLVMVEKGMLPLAINPANPPQYPTEWVEDLLAWVETSRRQGKLVQFKGLLHALCNEERKKEWIERNQQKFLRERKTAIHVQKDLEVKYVDGDTATRNSDPSD